MLKISFVTLALGCSRSIMKLTYSYAHYVVFLDVNGFAFLFQMKNLHKRRMLIDWLLSSEMMLLLPSLRVNVIMLHHHLPLSRLSCTLAVVNWMTGSHATLTLQQNKSRNSKNRFLNWVKKSSLRHCYLKQTSVWCASWRNDYEFKEKWAEGEITGALWLLPPWS